MDDWTTRLIQDVMLKTPLTDPKKTPDVSFLYVDVSGVSNKTLEITTSEELLGKDAPSRARRIVSAGDVIFATVRPTLRRIAIVPDYLDGQVVSTGYFVFKPTSEVFNRFLFYYLQTQSFMGKMESLQSGASYPAVNDTQVKGQSISYPPVPEQQRIVAILDQAFADIEKARASAEKNLKNARELFDSYLQQVLSGENSVIQWKSLDDIVDSVTIGLVKNSREQDPGFDYTYIKMNNIGNNNSFNLFKSSAVNASDEEILKYGLRDNDFLFNTRNSVELVGKNCLYRSWSDAPVLYNNNIARIRFKDEISPAYAAYAFCSPFLKDQLESMKQGTTNVAAIYYKSLKNLKIGYPPIPEQKSIVASLDKLSDKVQQLEKRYQAKLESLDELKKSLLQKAFSGELTKTEGHAA